MRPHIPRGRSEAAKHHRWSGNESELAQIGHRRADFADKLKSRVYNIGTGVGVTLRDFERVIKKHIPNAQMEIGGGLNFYGFPYPATGVYDISRARNELELMANRDDHSRFASFAGT